MSSVTADPFGTARLRAAVLDAWRTSPTRFREDANLEEDYALGAYRDRLVVELAQNASDAAHAAGVPGRLLVRLDDAGLTAANVGTPLDRGGVESLAAMRASSKAGGAVGRFGVGFAAVLAVSDAPELRSRSGGVRFDRSATAELLAADPALAALGEQRAAPVLRLPFALDVAPPDGYETAVVLPWRDDDAKRSGLDAVTAIDDALLIALPHLDEVVVEIDIGDQHERHHWQVRRDAVPLVVAEDGVVRHWLLTTTTGTWSVVDDTSVPTEMRAGREWTATVAVPVTSDGAPTDLPSAVLRVVHAPTPTDESLGFPALVIADFPLDATRRRVVEGGRSAELTEALADAYVDLVIAIARDHGPAAAALIPEPALVGWLDTAIADGVRDRLSRAPWLPRASDGQGMRPGELAALTPGDAELVRTLAPHLVDLLDADWLPHLRVLRGLGVAVRPVNEVWDALAVLTLTPRDWHGIYVAAAAMDARDLEGLPVPLADGRVVRGARSTMVGGQLAEHLALLGVNVVHPDAEHALLERLGARPFQVSAVLDAAFVRLVDDAVGHDESEARHMLAAAVALLTDADVAPGELPELSDLPVPTTSGVWQAAASVVLPGSPLDAIVAASVPRLDAELVDSAPPAAWAALGVIAALTAVTLTEQPLDPEPWDDVLTDGGDWCAAVAELAEVDDPGELFAPEVTVVRGIELLDGVRLADVAEQLTSPDVRRALVTPTIIVTGDGRRVSVPSPAAWWLSEAPLLDGRCPLEVRIPGDDRLAPFFPCVSAPAGLDLDLLTAIGVHTTLENWLATSDGIAELLEAMVDPDVEISLALLADLYQALEAYGDELPDPPGRIRALSEGAAMVADADDVVVAIAPHHALVLQSPHLPGTSRLAEVLDLEVSDDAACAASLIAGTGMRRPVPHIPSVTATPETYREHDELMVGDVAVDWWVTDDGEIHTATVDGLARALAWASGQWGRRFELAALLEQPGSADTFAIERRYDR